jgi:RNA polymerase sigma factor (sigma-70 family)
MSTNEDLIPTRESLLTRLRNWEDAASWQCFFDTYWKLIYKTAKSAGLSDREAQEVVQSTLIAVCKSIRNFQYDPCRGSFKNWLRHTTTWRIQDHLRKKEREEIDPTTRLCADWTALDQGESSLPDAIGGNWESDWDENLREAALERVKQQVAPKQFQIFDLAVLKQWPTSRVAKAFDVNTAYVYLTKHRLRAQLKAELKKLRADPYQESLGSTYAIKP